MSAINASLCSKSYHGTFLRTSNPFTELYIAHLTSFVTHHFAELLGHADPGAVESPAASAAALLAIGVKVDRRRKREGAGDRLSAAAHGGVVGGLPAGRRVNFVSLHHHERGRHMAPRTDY